MTLRINNIQHNDSKHYDIQHSGLYYDTMHKYIQHNDTQLNDIQHNDFIMTLCINNIQHNVNIGSLYTQCFLCWVSRFLSVLLSAVFSFCYVECRTLLLLCWVSLRWMSLRWIFTGWSSTMVPLRSFPWVLTRTASPAWGRPNSGLPSTYSGKIKGWNIPDRRFEKVVKTNVCRKKVSFHSLQNRLTRRGGQLYLAIP